MEASAGSDGQQQEPVMEPAEQDLQLDQAEPDVDSQARSQLRMTEDEILEPPYGEPESLGPSVAGVSPGQQGEALSEVVSQEPRGEEVLASLRPAEAIPAVAVEESPESWRRSESRQSEETRLQQLTSVLETLLQGQQALNNRLERVEEVRSSHSWRSAESSQGLGWVDHTALDRWYTEATARAAASGHRDASMYIAGDVQSFPRPAELANPWLRPPGWWTSRHEAGLGGLGGCGGPSPPPGFGGQPTPWTFPHPPPALPSSSPPGPPFLGQTPWQSNPFDGPDRSLPQRFEAQVLPEAQALQDRSLQHGFDAQITSEAQAMHGRVGHRGSEAQALHDRSWQASPEASAVQERATLQQAEVQALQERASQQRSEAQAATDRKRVSGEAKAVGGGSEGSTAMSATTKATISVEGESIEELTGATTAPPALPPGTKLQVRIDGHLRDVVVNDSGGLEAGPAQYYIGSLRHTSPPGVRGNSVPRAPGHLSAVNP